jgi:hypothetical protein
MRYTWRIDSATRLVIVRTDGGPEWTPKTEKYAADVAYVDRTWGATVVPIAERHGLRAEGILAQIVQESRGNPRAFRQEPNGWTGIGLMQITHPSLKRGHTDAELYDPALNLEIGTRYTASLARQYHTLDGLPDWPRVFAAFNAGSPRADPKSPWNLFCYGNHVDAEVAFYNTLLLSRLSDVQTSAIEAVEHQFDLVATLDLSPHHQDRDIDPAPPPDFEES